MSRSAVTTLLRSAAAAGLAVAIMAGAVQAQAPRVASAEVKDRTGKVVGQVSLTQMGSKVQVEGRFMGLPPGFHGFHVHAVGDCSGDFTPAGPHYNPAGVAHPGHAGDLPALLVNPDGSADYQAETDRFQLAQLFDANGSAFMVHGNPDNFSNIPPRYGQPDAMTLEGGDSGARIACAVVRTGMAMASDGRSLGGEPANVQASFRAVWGDLADEQWALEHK